MSHYVLLVGCLGCTTTNNFEDRLQDAQEEWADRCDVPCPDESTFLGTIVDENKFTSWACVDYFAWRDALDSHCYRYTNDRAALCIKTFAKVNRDEACTPNHPLLLRLRDSCYGAYTRDCLTEDI